MISFGGLSQTGYTTHSARPGELYELLVDDLHASFGGTITIGMRQLRFLNDADGPDACARVLGCVLFSLMPEEALREALDQVADVFRFHTWCSPKDASKRLPVTVAGKVVGRTTVPQLDLSE